jgi:release factor glutamine methyltransferase
MAVEDRTAPEDLAVIAGDRRDLVRAIAAQVGSATEAGWIVDHAESEVGPDPTRVSRYATDLARRRAEGEPLQYVLGRWPFRRLELAVDTRVLIPRPETEQVTEVALAELRRVRAGVTSPCRCVDLGTGSGAIALSLAVEVGPDEADLEIWAVDRSTDSLAVAETNRQAVAVTDPRAAGRVHLVEGSWFDPLPTALSGRVDLVVANPPYVAECEYPELDPTVRLWEPREALVSPRGAGGVGGMADIETVVAGARRWLHRTGVLVVEMAPHQAYAAIDAARRAGFASVSTERDLAGRLRTLVARCG